MGLKLPPDFVFPPGTKSLGINLDALFMSGPASPPTPRPEPVAAPEPNPILRLSHEISIPGWLPPPLNKLMRGKIATRIALGKKCKAKVAAACERVGVPPAVGKRRLTLVLGLAPRDQECDVDAPFKGLLDALVKAKALRDDKVRWVEVAPLRTYRRATTLTTILLEELEPDA